MPDLLDHLLVLAFAVAMPLRGNLSWPGFVRDIESGKPGALTRGFVETMVYQVGFTAAALWIWHRSQRDWSALGLTFQDTAGAWIVLAIGTATIVFAISQLVRFYRGAPKDLASVRAQLAPVRALMPRTASEHRLAHAAAVGAGISEEILWRGFLVWYLAAFLPLWAAAAAAVLAFGAAHLYQGVAGAAKCTVMGGVGCALYLASGSLAVPILLHVIVDIQGLLIGSRIVSLDAGART